MRGDSFYLTFCLNTVILLLPLLSTTSPSIGHRVYVLRSSNERQSDSKAKGERERKKEVVALLTLLTVRVS